MVSKLRSQRTGVPRWAVWFFQWFAQIFQFFFERQSAQTVTQRLITTYSSVLSFVTVICWAHWLNNLQNDALLTVRMNHEGLHWALMCINSIDAGNEGNPCTNVCWQRFRFLVIQLKVLLQPIVIWSASIIGFMSCGERTSCSITTCILVRERIKRFLKHLKGTIHQF